MKGGGEGFRVVVLVSGGGRWGFVNNSFKKEVINNSNE